MKKFAKILCIILCLAMVLSFASAAFAAEEGKTYVKVTADQDDWSGTYLLVCEASGYAFNSGAEKLDAAKNSLALTVAGDRITTAENIAVTVEKVDGGYVMKAANGEYFYGQSGANKLLTTTDLATAAAAPISFSFVEGELAIVSATSHMRFNVDGSQLRFRFFKEATYANQAAVSLFKLDESAEPAAEEVTIPEAIEIAKEANGKKYIVRGTVSEVKNTTWGNMYVEDAEGNKLYIYGTYSADGSVRYDAMEVKPNVGDEVVLMGELSTYNGESQMKNGWLLAHTLAPEPPAPTPDPVEISIPKANEIAMGQEHNTYTAELYIVTGVISEIKNETYGNMYIQDAEGNSLYLYGLYNEAGERYDAMATKPVVGDTITVVGALGQYYGSAQMKNGTMTAHTPAAGGGEEPTPEPTPDPVEITIAEAIAIGAAKEHNTFTEEKYIVTGEIVEIASETWGNMYIQDAEGNKLYIYGLYDVDGNRYDALATKPAVGDTVTLVGILGQYNGNAQMKNATMTAHTPAQKEDEPGTEGSVTTEHNFDSLVDVNIGSTEDKAEIPEGTTFADGFFTVIGKLTQRYQESKGGIYAVEIAKNGQGAMQFTVEGTANVTFVVSSTGKENVSAVALINVATGEVIANVEGLSEVSTTSTTTLTYKDLPAGTYQLVSPQSDYNRGFRLMTIHVEQTVTGPAQTGDFIMVAVCSLLVSGGALAILPKKREF